MVPSARGSLRLWLACVVFAILTTACHSVRFDLSQVPVPVSAKPGPESGGTPFRIEKKTMVWVHGLFGQSDPDVATLVADAAKGYSRVAGFRVSVGGDLHDWLITHLSLTLIRMKTVTIEGVLIK